MRSMLCAFAFAVVLSSVALSTVRAADERPSTSKDGFLVSALATASSLERFSELAQKKTEDAAVKEFAGQVSEKAKECREKLTAYAVEAKIGLVAGLEKGRQAAFAGMRLKTGKEFDRAYLDQVISDLEDADTVMKKADKEENVKLKESGSRGGKDCKAWLEKAREIRKAKFGTEK